MYLLNLLKSLKNQLKENNNLQLMSSIETLDLRNCRHYCGFRYGSRTANFYNDYTDGLFQGEDISILREKFICNLLSYRPKSMNDVLQCDFSTQIPLWTYPWKKNIKSKAWSIDRIEDLPDIITHFSLSGIPYYRVNEEFFWLERAFNSIKKNGYQPDSHDHIQALKIQKGSRSFLLLLDGNHRAAALCSMSHFFVPIRIKNVINIDRFEKRAINKIYTKDDIKILFDRYYEGVSSYFVSCEKGFLV